MSDFTDNVGVTYKVGTPDSVGPCQCLSLVNLNFLKTSLCVSRRSFQKHVDAWNKAALFV